MEKGRSAGEFSSVHFFKFFTIGSCGMSPWPEEKNMKAGGNRCTSMGIQKMVQFSLRWTNAAWMHNEMLRQQKTKQKLCCWQTVPPLQPQKRSSPPADGCFSGRGLSSFVGVDKKHQVFPLKEQIRWSESRNVILWNWISEDPVKKF